MTASIMGDKHKSGTYSVLWLSIYLSSTDYMSLLDFLSPKMRTQHINYFKSCLNLVSLNHSKTKY